MSKFDSASQDQPQVKECQNVEAIRSGEEKAKQQASKEKRANAHLKGFNKRERALWSSDELNEYDDEDEDDDYYDE